MAEIKPTQTAITADTSGMAQGVQVDTSALKEANARTTSLFQSAFKAGTETFKAGVLDAEQAGAEGASTGFFQDIQETDTALAEKSDYLKILGEEPASEDDEGPFGRNAVMESLQADVANLSRKRGQLSTAQFDIMMAVKQNESINKYPWMEKSIASMYGDVTGRTKAVRDIMDTAEKSQAKAQAKQHQWSIGILKEASIPVSGDINQDVHNATRWAQSVQKSVQQVATGTTGTGTAGFTADSQGHYDRSVAEMSVFYEQGIDSGNTKLAEATINDYVLKYESDITKMYGSDINPRLYDAHISRVRARADTMKNVLNGTMQVEQSEQQNALRESIAKDELFSNDAFLRASIASEAVGRNAGMSNFIALNYNTSGGTEFLGKYISGTINNNVDSVVDIMLGATPTERKNLSKYNQLAMSEYITNPTDETDPILANVVNTSGAAMVDGKDYYPDQINSFLNVSSRKEFLDTFLKQQPLVLGEDINIDTAFNPRILQQVGVQGMDNGLESVRTTLSQEQVPTTGAILKDYVQLHVNEDGTVQLKATNLDAINSIMPDPARQVIAKQGVQDIVDKLNRTSIVMLNNGGKTHAHGNGNSDYRTSIGFKLAEFGLDQTIEIVDEFAPKQPAAPEPTATVTIDRGPLQGDVPAQDKQVVPARFATDPNFPTTGVELDVDELTKMVDETPASNTDARENRLRNFENSFTNPDGGWSGTAWEPHVSPEGGNRTLAYGPQLTDAEVRSGNVRIGTQDVAVANGITNEQAQQLFQQDWTKAQREANTVIKKNKLQSIPRRARMILSEMAYQMGGTGVGEFTQMIGALQKGDYFKAAKQMRNSKWWKRDSRSRAEILASEMERLDD